VEISNLNDEKDEKDIDATQQSNETHQKFGRLQKLHWKKCNHK